MIVLTVCSILSQKGFFEKVQPINFNTIATPHIGLPRYPSWVSSLFSALGPKLLSRTGEQFYSVDKWSPSGRPLLVVMADPGQSVYQNPRSRQVNMSTVDRVFYQALLKFKNLRIFANAYVPTDFIRILYQPFLQSERLDCSLCNSSNRN